MITKPESGADFRHKKGPAAPGADSAGRASVELASIDAAGVLSPMASGSKSDVSLRHGACGRC